MYGFLHKFSLPNNSFKYILEHKKIYSPLEEGIQTMKSHKLIMMTIMLIWVALLLSSLCAQHLSFRHTRKLPEKERIIYVGQNENGELFLGIRTGERLTPHRFLLKTIDGKVLYQSPSNHRYSFSLISPDKRFILLEYELMDYEKKPDVEKVGATAKYILVSTNGNVIHEERKSLEYEQDRSMGLSNDNFIIRLNSKVFIFQNDGTLIDKVDLSKFKYSTVNLTMPGLKHIVTQTQLYFAINYAERNKRDSTASNSRPTYKAKLLSYDLSQRSMTLVDDLENDQTVRNLAYITKMRSLYIYSALHSPRGDIASTRLIKVNDTERRILLELENSRMDALENYLVFSRYQSFRVFDTETLKFIFESSTVPLQKAIINDTLYLLTATPKPKSPSNEKRRRQPVAQKLLNPQLTIVDLKTGRELRVELKSSMEQMADFSYRLPEPFFHANLIYIPFYNQLFIVQQKREKR